MIVMSETKNNLSKLQAQLKDIEAQKKRIEIELRKESCKKHFDVLIASLSENSDALEILGRYKVSTELPIFLKYMKDGFDVMAEKSAEEIQALRERRKASDEKRRISRQKNLEQQSEQAEQTVEIDANAFGSDEGIDSYDHSYAKEEEPSW